MNTEVSVETQARQLGWVPIEDFKGDPSRWTDAETFVEKGKHIMPILQKNNEKLQSELAALRARQEQQDAALRSAQEALEDMQEKHNAETQKAVDAARKELKAQIKLASENGDHEALVELTDQLTQMPVDAPKPERKAAAVATPLPPEYLAWEKDNPWFGKDIRRTALANAIGQELRASGSPLVGRPFWDKVSEEVEAMFSPKDRPGDDKVAGSRGGSDATSGSTYADLPADAKAACDADIKHKVGEGKRYKTAAEWRNRYAQLYFGE